MGAVLSRPDTKIGGGGGGGRGCAVHFRHNTKGGRGDCLAGRDLYMISGKGNSMIVSYPDPRYVSIIAIWYYDTLCLRKRGSGYETNSE